MGSHSEGAIAVVGLGAILPDAMNVPQFWDNLLHKCYSINEVPPERWSADLYYDADPSAPDKTYSKIGGWVRGFHFDWKGLRIPPKVAAAMDESQKWALAVTSQVLGDYGYPERPLNLERTAAILGTAMGGEMHYLTFLRISFPELARALEGVPEFTRLPSETRKDILRSWQSAIGALYPPVTEDSMPGELANVISGRVANVFNLRGPNYITDAACASSLAALEASVQLLASHQVDAVLTGGVDHNMGASSFVKFCKIGALSATGSRPFGRGADGFVMGEGAAAFLLKRLDDAEQDGDRIYAVIRGVGGASDGKGKGIYAPNPVGQQLAVRRAWEYAGLDPATATLVEAHGTSTRVGDVVEWESLQAVFNDAAPQSIALGSVKSNMGHLKAAAGAAGLLKGVLALHYKILPPTLNAEIPNPDIDIRRTPFSLVQEAREWSPPRSGSGRRCGVSAYGFGGTNFHVVLEEHIPGALAKEKGLYAGANFEKEPTVTMPAQVSPPSLEAAKPPVRGILALGAGTTLELRQKLAQALLRVQEAGPPPREAPGLADLVALERLVIDFDSPEELVDRLQKAQRALEQDAAPVWKAIQAQGIFRGSGREPGKIAFLFPGQGSQYLNMGKELISTELVVAAVFREADRVMTPILGKPLSPYIFTDSTDPEILRQSEISLMQTAITQPAMLAMDIALFQLLETYGFKPDMVMGHSLGEYAALIAAGAMPFADAMEAVAARGREMTAFSSLEDNGWMAAVMAPYQVVQETLAEIDDYVVAANINSYNQCVIGGASRAVSEAIEAFQRKGFEARRIPVSHAFHTRIVAPASKPLRQVLNRLRILPPRLPVIANVSGDFYPQSPDEIRDMMEQQVASPVQWIRGLETLYAAGARVFVEVGPKKALKGFVDDVLGGKEGIISLFTNHPKVGELPAFNQALCGLYAAGCGQEILRLQASTDWTMEVGEGVNEMNGGRADMETANRKQKNHPPLSKLVVEEAPVGNGQQVIRASREATAGSRPAAPLTSPDPGVKLEGVGQLLIQALQQVANMQPASALQRPYDRNDTPTGSVVITGTGLGLPGAEKTVMDPDNAQYILRGEQFIDLIPERFRQKMLEKRVTRVVKAEDGSGRFELIQDLDEGIRLAGRPGAFDLSEEYGVPAKLVEALDITTQLAMAAGLDALREAGIPLVQSYRQATTGKLIPDRWMLPEALRDETGVIFASAFPGGDRMADEFARYYAYHSRLEQLQMLEDLRCRTQDASTLEEILHRIHALKDAVEHEPYIFDRRFIFRVLSMGHSQFAEYIGARGPNTHVNAACASTTHAIGLAEDWIRTGRCRRVIVIAADNPSGDHLLEWLGAGLLATGAVATDDSVEQAALPFDRRRHGTIIGMGSCALVLESEDSVRERGMRGIVELLSSEISNSAFHGTRLNPDHIAQVMESLVTAAERRFGIHRYAIAPQTVFMSHETFTPARGGSASAEVAALRRSFGEAASSIIVSNTKGFTGHAFGVGIEDVAAVKILEYGIVPPVPNHREPDPELGLLNLSRGGRYPVQYALHLAAGFGSQIAMVMLRRIPGRLDRVDSAPHYRRWLSEVSGYDWAETETVQRVLRVKDQGAPAHPPAPSAWQPGTGPALRARAVGNGAAPAAAETSGSNRATVEEIAPNPHPAEPQEPVDEVRTTQEIPEAAVDDRRWEKAEAGTPPVPVPSPSDPIADRVLEIVAEKTGYPVDMLEVDLDLEADLGVDTVKQAETFLALREAFDIPKREDLRLRDYPTLTHVIGFVKEMKDEGRKTDEATDIGRRTTYGAAAEPAAIVGDQSSVVGGESFIADRVLEIVAEKTGYPKDMLELDLDLEADLGVDTVKQAETFVALREAFNIPRQENLKLRDYPTLGHVIEFVKEMRPELVRETKDEGRRAEDPSDEITPPLAAGGDNLQPSVSSDPSPAGRRPSSTEAANRLPRRVPVPVFRPQLDLCKPTGVTLGQQSRVVVAMDRSGVGRALVSRLEKRGVEVLILKDDPGTPINSLLKGWLEKGPIQGVYWLPALEVEPCLEEMTLEEWRELNRRRVKDLYTTMRLLYPSAGEPGSFLVAATRLGGLHGYLPLGCQWGPGALAPLGGAVTGFVKSYKREQNLALVKAVDFETGRRNAGLAEALIDETLLDPGCVEVGYWQDNRYSIALFEQPIEDGNPGLNLDERSIFLVTGAAGGITSAIVADLAQASGGTFYLLDLAALPERQDASIQLFRKDRESLKQKMIEEGRAGGERTTPAKIEKQILSIERQEAALRSVEAVESAGGRAYYASIDLLDSRAVDRMINEIRQRHGKIDVLIHAAGVEISRALPEKDPQQFDLVYGVKADGLFNLLHAAKGLPIEAVAVFSSIAGRFGNAGQTDYSAANDLLCKITSSLRNWRPETRGIALDWTAWEGIGMAARGSIPKIMQLAGIELLPPEVGIPTLRRELTGGGQCCEVVVAGQLGMLLEEWDPTGGLDADKTSQWLAKLKPQRLMVGEVKSAKLHSGFEIETVLEPKEQPFLHDHAMDGTPLLPGVMGTEAFAEMASVLAPGFTVTAVENESFGRAFKFFDMEPQRLYLNARIFPTGEGELLAHTVLKSKRALAGKGGELQEKTHFTAGVRLTREPLLVPTVDFAFHPEGWTEVAKKDIYSIYFHGPAYQVLESVFLSEDQACGVMASSLPPDTHPAGAAGLMAPRLMELCLQTAGMWELKTRSALALPSAVRSVTVFKQRDEASRSPLYAMVKAVDGGASFDAQVMDQNGTLYLSMTGYRTVALPMTLEIRDERK